MSDILIIGKDLPDSLDLAEGFSSKGKKVFAACKSEADAPNFEAENIFAAVWNRASAISSRAMLIKAETKLSELNQYCFVFDSYNYSSKFELDRTEDVSSAVDTMISGYQYFINELLFRLEQTQEPSFITFFLKSYPSKYEIAFNGNKNPNLHSTSNLVNSAQNAFISLAENIATIISERQNISVLLCRCDPSNEFFNNEKEIASWISQSMDQIINQKNKQSIKQATSWAKIGGKIPSGFSLFK